jgi:hypothetical protein
MIQHAKIKVKAVVDFWVMLTVAFIFAASSAVPTSTTEAYMQFTACMEK